MSNKMNWKYILAIILVAIVAGIIVFNYAGEIANVDPTAPPSKDSIEWKTYESKEYGFQVDYPEEWQVKESEVGNEVTFGEEKEGVFKPGFKVVFYSELGELPSPKGADSLDTWLSEKFLPLEGEEVKEETEVGVEDYEATLVKSYKPVGVTSLVTRVFLKGNEAIYEINNGAPSASTEDFSTDYDYEKVFDSMLDSFEFTAIEEDSDESIQVSQPEEDQMVESPLTVKGQAKGTWFFEGTFSVKLENDNGEVLASTQAQAQGDWMTEDFVDFEAALEFETPKTETGTLILEKANPSGKPENKKVESIPVKFSTQESSEEQVYEPNESIKLRNIQPDKKIESPALIEGEAKGTWYFEASFPVELEDENGNKLAEGSAQAQGDWMTEDFVDFETELTFEQPTTDTGTLILKKANPSGMPENAEKVEIPVKFE